MKKRLILYAAILIATASCAPQASVRRSQLALNKAVTYIRQGDTLIEEIYAAPEMDYGLTKAKLEEAKGFYQAAGPYLERAHRLNASDQTVVALLLNVYFRLRDDSPEMMRNYEKYRDVLEAMPQPQ